MLPPQDGYLFVDPAKFPTAFAADVDPTTTHFMAAAQVPWGLQAVQTRITKAAWKTKPTHYLVTTKDAMIPPTAQRTMAKRTGARTVEIASSHAVMLAHPAGGGGLHQGSGRSDEIAASEVRAGADRLETRAGRLPAFACPVRLRHPSYP